MTMVVGAPLTILVLLILLHFHRFLIEIPSRSMIEVHFQKIIEVVVGVVGAMDVDSQEGVVVDHLTSVEGVVEDHLTLVEGVVEDRLTLVVEDLDSVMGEVEV